MKNIFKNTNLIFDTEKIAEYDEVELSKITDYDEDGVVFFLVVNDNYYMYYIAKDRDFDYEMAIGYFKNTVTEVN